MPKQDAQYSRTRLTFFLVTVVLFTLLFNGESYKTWATRLPVGMSRSVYLSLFEPLAQAEASIGLNEPSRAASQLFQDVSGITTDAGFLADDGQPQSNSTASDSAFQKPIDSTAVQDQKPFSKKNPLRVLLIGDSMMGVGTKDMFLELAKSDSTLRVKEYHTNSSGLSRTDFYNWGVQVHDIFKRESYDVVFVFLGTNDAQGFVEGSVTYSYGTDEWFAKYAEKVDGFIGTLENACQKVYWLGMPRMMKSGFDERMQKLNEIYAETAGKHFRSTFIATVPLLSGPDGNYASHIFRGSKQINVRQGDGIHLTNPGGLIVAEAMLAALKRDFRFE